MGDVGNKGMDARLRVLATSMRRKAESVGSKLQAIAEGIAKKYGARVTPINYKSVDSIVRKAKGETNGIKDIKDSYRTTIIAGKESIPKIIKDLKGKYKNFEFVRNRNLIQVILETSSISGTRRPDLLVRYKSTLPR